MNVFKKYYNGILELNEYPIVSLHLTAIAQKLHEGLERKIDYLFKEVNNYHPKYLGQPTDKLQNLEWSIEDCQMTIAYEYGFSSWSAVQKLGNVNYNIPFEKAVNSIVEGDLDHLKYYIDRYPQLVFETSKYGHQATLLHYTASNGVEIWRQRSPQNLPQITKYLLQKGAKIDATMKVYGGLFTTRQLLMSSAHPYEAGVGKQMEEILQS